jgi:hypothetical protein
VVPEENGQAGEEGRRRRKEPSRNEYDPGFLLKAGEISKEVQKVARDFIKRRPSKRARETLVDQLDAFFFLIQNEYLSKTEGSGRRAAVNRIRGLVRGAAIGLGRLESEDRISIDDLSDIHDRLLKLNDALRGLPRPPSVL